MKVFESKQARRLVVRLDRGEEVMESLRALAKRERVRAGWVRGVGSLAWIELDRHDQARKKAEPPQRFETPCDLLGLEGNVSVAGGEPALLVHVTVARRTDNGIDVIGGRLRGAAAFACELVVECFDDLVLTRAADESTGLPTWAGQSERAQPAPRPTAAWTRAPAPEDEDDDEEADDEDGGAGAPSGVSWADVAAVSAAPEVPARDEGRRRPSGPPRAVEKRHDDDLADEPHPEKGDFIDHRQFGLCKVDREDEDGGLVIRLPSGVRKVIKLDFMEVGHPRMEGTRRVFPVRPRRR